MHAYINEFSTKGGLLFSIALMFVLLCTVLSGEWALGFGFLTPFIWAFVFR